MPARSKYRKVRKGKVHGGSATSLNQLAYGRYGLVSAQTDRVSSRQIEAARQAIMNEVYRVIEAQGLNIDIRHVMLVADIMCASGIMKGVTRYGVVSEKASVLARASFETPIKHLINAALEGEVDHLTSVVENVMITQPVPLGTGLPSLITKMK